MINPRQRNVIRKRVHARIREKISGTAIRPRLNVFRSVNHIYTQLVDDASGVTLASASTVCKKGEEKKLGGTIAAAREVGRAIAAQAREKGIQKVVFDRGGYLYHGRVKAIADAAREAGLDF